MIMDTALTENLYKLLPHIFELSSEAGKKILRAYEGEIIVETKSDMTPVTSADFVSNAVITQGLQTLTPTIPVVSEEQALEKYSIRRTWKHYWLVDPLDGTKEFIKRSGEFTINIAYISHHQPLLGVIYWPVKNRFYFAVAGKGAFIQNGFNHATAIQVSRAIHQPPIVATSRLRKGPKMTHFLERLGSYNTIEVGSALKSCFVAEGRADVYVCFGPTSEWDTAAAQCIVQEAGGYLTNLKLETLRYNEKESIINPTFLVYATHGQRWLSCIR